MAIRDDVVDWITSEIDTIGLATGDSVGDELDGGGYAALSPSYAPSSGGEADLTATLEFDGPENSADITHLIFRNTGGVWVIRPVTGTPEGTNSDGRIDLQSAPVTVDFAS